MVVSIAVMMASFRRSKNQTAGLVVQKKAAMYALPREILCDVSLSKYSARHCVGLYLTTLRPKLVFVQRAASDLYGLTMARSSLK